MRQLRLPLHRAEGAGGGFLLPGLRRGGQGRILPVLRRPGPEEGRAARNEGSGAAPGKGRLLLSELRDQKHRAFLLELRVRHRRHLPARAGPAGAPVKNVYTARENVHKPAAPALMISRRTRWSAFVLCLFLGGFGFHRFYVGKTGTGLLYFFTGGLFLAGWICDLICILTGIFRDGEGKYLK